MPGQSRSPLLIREVPQVIIDEEEPTGEENNVEFPSSITDLVDNPAKQRTPRRILPFASNITPGDTCGHDAQDTSRNTVPKVVHSLGASRCGLAELAHPRRCRSFAHGSTAGRSHDPRPEASQNACSRLPSVIIVGRQLSARRQTVRETQHVFRGKKMPTKTDKCRTASPP